MNKPYAINLGLTLGVISIILFLIQALFSGGMVYSILVGILSIALVIILPIIFIRKQRAANGGFISFKDAFLTSFVGLAISTVISIAFTLIYVNLIDTGYVDTMIMRQLETTQNFVAGNMPEDDATKMLMEMEQGIRDGFTVPGLIKTFGIYLAVFAVLSLILAAILKKEPEVTTGSEVIDN